MLEASSSFQKGIIQPADMRPKLYSRHAEFALEALFQVSIQTLVLRWVKLKIYGDVNWISGGLSIGEESRKRLQPNFMADHPHASLAGQTPGNRLWVHNPVEHNQDSRFNLV